MENESVNKLESTLSQNYSQGELTVNNKDIENVSEKINASPSDSEIASEHITESPKSLENAQGEMNETPRDLENVQEKVTVSPRNVTEAQEKLYKNSRNPKNTYGKVSESPKNSLNVPLPTSDPYMNFIQDFRAKYKGEEVTNTVMAALAAAKWRTMSEQERQPYVDITKKGREEKHNGIESLRKYITSLAV
ncbi:hypothetical protein J6590_017136 [Homalodisca vitripennis]|nr:hypothetical protein J6590_017136 [Homalodisca vitripennis]